MNRYSGGFPECHPRPVRAGDLRCGDLVHTDTWLGVSHWIAGGRPHPSYPVPGRWQVSRSGQGTLTEFRTLDEVVMVCSTGHCGSSLCGAMHREGEQ
jgi:hypothetical protein